MMKNETDFQNKWRPAMGWAYIGICLFDFVIGPTFWSTLQSIAVHGAVVTEWKPLTLQGGGLFHISMGAILGATAYGRSQEKITAMNQFGGMQTEEVENTTITPVGDRPRDIPPSN